MSLFASHIQVPVQKGCINEGLLSQNDRACICHSQLIPSIGIVASGSYYAANSEVVKKMPVQSDRLVMIITCPNRIPTRLGQLDSREHKSLNDCCEISPEPTRLKYSNFSKASIRGELFVLNKLTKFVSALPWVSLIISGLAHSPLIHSLVSSIHYINDGDAVFLHYAEGFFHFSFSHLSNIWFGPVPRGDLWGSHRLRQAEPWCL